MLLKRNSTPSNLSLIHQARPLNGGLFYGIDQAPTLNLKQPVITQSGAFLGLAVLAPLTRYLHFIRLPDGTAGMAHPCAAPPFARVLRAILADS